MSAPHRLTHLLGNSTKNHSPRLRIALLLVLLIMLSLPTRTLYAAPAIENTATCNLAIEIIAAPYAVVDSNKPGVQGPQVAILGARITNKDAFVHEKIQIHLGDGVTAGQFPTTAGKQLTLLTGEAASRSLAPLASGASTVVYWTVVYPITFNITYNYTVWATGNDDCRIENVGRITTQESVSASSNKLLPKDSLLLLTPKDFAPGDFVTLKIFRFDLGSIGHGPKPLEPYDAWLQPIGNVDFDPTCLRLVRTEVLLESIAPRPFVDQLYFAGLKEYDNEDGDYVAYTFIVLRDCATTLKPYQQAASGSQEKYNGDYDVKTTRIKLDSSDTAELKLTIATDKDTVSAGDLLQVKIGAISNQAMGHPESGNPVVITAALPADAIYVEGSASADYRRSISQQQQPTEITYVAGSASAGLLTTLEYSTDQGLTWQQTLPSDPALVTRLRWRLQQPLNHTGITVGFDVTIKPGYSGNPLHFTATGSILDGIVLANATAVVSGFIPTPTPSPTPSPTATPDSGVGSGGDGGLESGPLPGEPSAFTGGIGTASDPVNTAAATAALRQHKARLLTAMQIRLEDIIPTQGPAGTTAKAAVPVDVLAVTNAPEAKAIDFVDGAGQIQAVALGILSLGGPYEHDYGVCNRFKEYRFDTIAPRQLLLPSQESGWFWHSHAVKNETIREEALFFHIFVDEANKQFHIDSRWIKDNYPTTFDFPFDYVFNLQLWSNDLAETQELLTSILTKLGQYDNGAWQLVYHNQAMPTTATLFVTQTTYRADEVELSLRSDATDTQPVRVYGAWRDHTNRNTLQSFDYRLDLPTAESKINLIFPGLLDATIYVESNGFTDKIYQGGGLWFPVKGEQENAPTLNLGQCRQLDEIDSQDLLLAGCADLTTTPLSGSDQAGIGRTLNPNGRTVDVSPYKALRFWAKGNGVPVRVILETAGVTNNDYFQTVFTPDNQWRQYMLPLAEFAQSASTAALTGTDVKAVIWLNAENAGRSLELSVDQVSFTNQGLLTELALPAATTTTAAQSLQVSGPNGIAQVTAHYSVDGGATFQSVALNQQPQTEPENSRFQGELPTQSLGADVIYYLETTYTNGYSSRNPIDAPASYYRYRVDDRAGLLIDDFAGEALSNRLTGSSGIFNNATAGGRLLAYQANHELILDYDVSTAAQFVGYFTNLPTVDARPYTTLDLLVRGAVGGEQVRIGLRNAQNVEKYISVGDLLPGGLTSEWQWVQVPLRNFAPQMDLSALTSLSFFFAHDDGNSQGRFYVKELRLTSLGAPLVIDNFDDATLESNGQLMGYWSTAPNSTLNATLVAGDAQKATGKALQLQYTIGANGYAIWNSALKQPTVQPESVLTFWVKGTPATVPTNLYLSSVNGRARVGLQEYVTLHNQWQRVEIPLAAFVAPGFDPNALTGFQVAFEFGQGSGELGLDQIEIGTPGAPQAGQRLLYLRDVDHAAVALHLPYGGAWQAQSDVPWLFTASKGVGATTMNVSSVNWALAPGTYTGHVTIRTAGHTETITAQLTVTQTGAPANRLFLPILAR